MKCNVGHCTERRVKKDVLCKRHRAQRTQWEKAIKKLRNCSKQWKS